MAGENKVELSASISIEKLVTDLQASRTEADRLRTELAAMNKSLKEGFDKSSAAARDMGQELKSALGRIEAQQKIIQKLNADLDTYAKNSGKAFDDTKLKQYQEQIKKLETELAALKGQSVQAAQGVSQVNTQVQATGAAANKAKELIKGLFAGFSLAAVAQFALAGIVEVVGVLGEKIFGLSKEQKLQIAIQKDLIAVNNEAAKSTLDEKIKLEQLLVVARDKTKSDKERQLAIKAINDISPEFLGNITKENVETVAAAVAITGYISNLDAKARAQAYAKTIQDLYIKLIGAESSGLEDNIKWYEKLWNVVLSGGNATGEAIRNLKTAKENRDQNVKAINNEIGAITNKMNADLKSGSAAIDTTKQQKDLEKEKEKDKREAEAAARKSEAALRKAEAARAKALREEEARLERILSLEKQLAQINIELLKEGRGKDVANENARFDVALKSLETLRNKEKTSAEEKRLIDQLIQKQRELHTKKLLDIDNKYYQEAISTFNAAQDAINGVLLKDEDKEINDLKKKYQGLFKILDEAKKKINESNLSPIAKQVQVGIVDKARGDLEEKSEKEIFDIGVKWDLKKLEEEEKIALNTNEILKGGEVAKLNLLIFYGEKRIELLKSLGEDENKVQISNIETAIANSKEALGKLAGSAFSISDLVKKALKVPDEDMKGVMNALSIAYDAAQSLVDSFVKGIDRQIEAKQRLIDKLDEGIEKQRSVIEEEMELQKNGFANNLALEESRLVQMEANRQREIEQEKKLAKEKATLQKAQILADSVGQASNLATAATDIFKTLSKLGPVGVGIAIGTIGLMIGAFVKSKAEALKAASPPKFRKGDRFDIYNALQGAPTHEQGGAGLYDERTGRKIAEFEGDEKLFTINKGSSRKYEPLLDAINKDQLSNWTYNDLKKFIQPTGIEFNRERIESRLPKGDQINIIQSPGISSKAEKALEDLVNSNKDIAATNRQLLDLEKNKEEVTELPDRTIYKKGNYTRVVNKTNNT